MGFFHAGDDAQGLPEIRGYGGIGRHAGFRFQWATVQVQVLLPAPPRQKNAAPFRFRGLRKCRENCTSAASFFLSETEVSRGTSVSVMENGSDLDCPGAPKRRGSEQDLLLFGGPPSAGDHPLRSNV